MRASKSLYIYSKNSKKNLKYQKPIKILTIASNHNARRTPTSIPAYCQQPVTLREIWIDCIYLERYQPFIRENESREPGVLYL